MNEYPYWWETAPDSRTWIAGGPMAASERLQAAPEVRRCDVAVVGAGYTGLSAGRHLAQAGASVLLLEREHVGWGASSRNGGQMLTGLRVGPATLVARYGEAGARRLFDVSLEALAHLEALLARESIECGYEKSGHLMAAWKPSHFADFRREQALLSRVFQHPVELIAKSAQRSELGSDAYHGLLIDERSRALNPTQYVLGLAGAARRAGAIVAERTTVRHVAKQGRRWRLATNRGDIDAADVLFATNGYTDDAAPALRRRFVPIGSYVIATEPLDPSLANSLLPRRRMAFDSKNLLYYFRLTRDNRMMFGGRAEFNTPTADTTRRAGAILRRGMAAVFPQLSRTKVEFVWGGRVAFTRDQMPHAGRFKGAYYAGGYCGHGIAMATYLGEIIARRLGGEPIEHPLIDDAKHRFAAIPFYNGTPWFLPVAGAYYRLLDVLQ